MVMLKEQPQSGDLPRTVFQLTNGAPSRLRTAVLIYVWFAAIAGGEVELFTVSLRPRFFTKT